MKRNYLVLAILAIILICSGAAAGLVIHLQSNKPKSSNNTAVRITSPKASAPNSQKSTSTNSVSSEPANAVCMPTSNTVSGPDGVTLTITVNVCKENGVYTSSSATSNYTNNSGASIGYAAPLQKVNDTPQDMTLYNASVSYSYQSSDGATQSGNYILILHADVTNTGVVSFNQSNGG